MNPRRVITFVYVFVLTGLGLAAGALFFETQQEFNRLRRTEQSLRRQVAEAEQRLKEQDRVLERLKTDRDYVEKVIRKQLNYARPGDVIFKFED